MNSTGLWGFAGIHTPVPRIPRPPNSPLPVLTFLSVLSVIHITTMTSQEIHKAFVVGVGKVEQANELCVASVHLLQSAPHDIFHTRARVSALMIQPYANKLFQSD